MIKGDAELGWKRIIGMEIRTTNMNGRSFLEQSKLWNDFFTSGAHEKIMNKINAKDVLGVYSEYESDHTGEYSFLVGFEVEDKTPVPDGMVLKKIPPQSYIVFSEDKKGDVGKKVSSIWSEVWNSGVKRAYSCDIEFYRMDTIFSDAPHIEIFISVL